MKPTSRQQASRLGRVSERRELLDFVDKLKRGYLDIRSHFCIPFTNFAFEELAKAGSLDPFVSASIHFRIRYEDFVLHVLHDEDISGKCELVFKFKTLIEKETEALKRLPRWARGPRWSRHTSELAYTTFTFWYDPPMGRQAMAAAYSIMGCQPEINDRLEHHIILRKLPPGELINGFLWGQMLGKESAPP